MYANKFQCTCPCGQQVCLLLCSLKYCILNIFQIHACPWKYHVVWTKEKKEDWVTVVTFKQKQNSLRHTVVPSSWIDTLGEDEIWIIVRFYVFTMSFFLVLWMKDRRGGKSMMLQLVPVDSTLKMLQEGVDAVTEHQMFLDYFKCKL